MFFDVYKYRYTGSLFNTLYTEIKHQCLKKFSLDKISVRKNALISSFTSSNPSQFYFRFTILIPRMHHPWQKVWEHEKNMALRARFKKLRGEAYYQGGLILRGAGEGLFSEGARFSRATMFSCKRVISY